MWNLKVASSNPWWVRFWKFQISCPGMKKKTQTKNQIIGCLDNGRNGRKIPPEQAGLWSLRCWHEVLFWGENFFNNVFLKLIFNFLKYIFFYYILTFFNYFELRSKIVFLIILNFVQKLSLLLFILTLLLFILTLL